MRKTRAKSRKSRTPKYSRRATRKHRTKRHHKKRQRGGGEP